MTIGKQVQLEEQSLGKLSRMSKVVELIDSVGNLTDSVMKKRLTNKKYFQSQDKCD